MRHPPIVNESKVIIVRKMLARKSVIRYFPKDNHIFESQMQLEASLKTNALTSILKFIVICKGLASLILEEWKAKPSDG